MSDVTLPMRLLAPGGNPVGEFRMGSAEGDYVTLVLYNADIINVRNIQGGVNEPGLPGRLNLDLGAGGDGSPSSAPRGRIVMNYDTGWATEIYGGRKEHDPLFSVRSDGTNQRVRSYAPHYLHKGAFVREGGGWRQL